MKEAPRVEQAPAAAPRLLADIGGTNARFAWQSAPGEPLRAVASLACADHHTLPDALRAYLQRTGRSLPTACAIAIANPVVGDRVAMTNHHWAFSIRGLKAQLGLESAPRPAAPRQAPRGG